MPDAAESPQTLLVVALDTPAALQPAITALQQTHPQIDLILLGCQPEWQMMSQWLGVPVHPYITASIYPIEPSSLIQWLRDRHFDAALICTAPSQSPYPIAYLCYLAGIPIRIGQSPEFGGQILSHCLPPTDPASSNPASPNHHHHLLQSLSPSLLSLPSPHPHPCPPSASSPGTSTAATSTT